MPAERVVPICPVPDAAVDGDQRRRAERLDVVDDGRLLAVAVRHRIGRAVARNAALALEGFDQRRLLAADVGARADVDRDVEVEARLSRDGLAEQALGAPAREHRAQVRQHVRVLAAQVEKALAGADHVRAHRHALDHEVGVAGEEHAVLERARLAFVGVADHVAPCAERGAAGLPLEAGGEAGAPASAQVRALDLLERLGRTLRDHRHPLPPRPFVGGELRVALAARDGGTQCVAGAHVGAEQDVAAVDVVGDREQLGRPVGERHTVADQVGDRIHPRVVEARDGDAVDEEPGALVAHAGARGRCHGHEAVLGHLAALDPQVAAEPVQQRFAPGHAVRDVVREQHVIAPDGLEVQERVVARDAFDLRARQSEPGGDVGDGRRREPAVDLLCRAQDLHQQGRLPAMARERAVQRTDVQRRRRRGTDHDSKPEPPRIRSR